jgi:uncharacterized protein (DUF2236 family)
MTEHITIGRRTARFGQSAQASVEAGAHRHVRSGPDSPVRYSAFDRDLQMWVAACLFVGLEDVYHLLRGVMTPAQSEQFYRSAWTLGTTLQVGDEQWPPTRAAFDDYWARACQRVALDQEVRGYLLHMVDLRMINPVLRLPFRPLLRFLTAGFLAPVFRDAVGLRWSPRRQSLFEVFFLVVGFRQPIPAAVGQARRQLRPTGRCPPPGAHRSALDLAEIWGRRCGAFGRCWPVRSASRR